jgi:hypothetical protein
MRTLRNKIENKTEYPLIDIIEQIVHNGLILEISVNTSRKCPLTMLTISLALIKELDSCT